MLGVIVWIKRSVIHHITLDGSPDKNRLDEVVVVPDLVAVGLEFKS
jgi:hypothetical protein